MINGDAYGPGFGFIEPKAPLVHCADKSELCNHLVGWLGMAGVWQYYRATGWGGLRWLAAGAAMYSLGAVVELANWPVIVPGVVRSHELLHVFDMAGTGCHIVFILKYVLPYRMPEPVTEVREDGEATGFAVPVEA